MSKLWRIQARDDSYVVLGANGDEALVSVKQYSSPATAKRAATRFADALSEGFILEYENGDGELEQVEYGAPGEAAIEVTVSSEEPTPAAMPKKIALPKPKTGARDSYYSV
jgi:hypothetical protein